MVAAKIMMMRDVFAIFVKELHFRSDIAISEIDVVSVIPVLFIILKDGTEFNGRS